jgi:hypothetical protein
LGHPPFCANTAIGDTHRFAPAAPVIWDTHSFAPTAPVIWATHSFAQTAVFAQTAPALAIRDTHHWQFGTSTVLRTGNSGHPPFCADSIMIKLESAQYLTANNQSRIALKDPAIGLRDSVAKPIAREAQYHCNNL